MILKRSGREMTYITPAKQRASHSFLRLRPWHGTALIAAAVYAASPLHRLAGGDSGELMAEACVGGVAHPPGYPLLLALLQLAHWIIQKLELLVLSMPLLGRDIGSSDEHVTFVHVANTLNAAFAVGAATYVTHVVDLWARRTHPLEAIASGLMFAMSPLAWEYAIGLEVRLHVLVPSLHYLQCWSTDAQLIDLCVRLALALRCLRSTTCSLARYTCSYFATFSTRALALHTLARSSAASDSRTSTRSVRYRVAEYERRQSHMRSAN